MKLSNWSCVASTPGAVESPAELDASGPQWSDLPNGSGTAASAAGNDSVQDFDASDWWFRCSFAHDGIEADSTEGCDGWVLEFCGLATLADVWLNGHHLLTSANMFRTHTVEVTEYLESENELVIRCASLLVELGRRRPRPRWKTNIVEHQTLRWFRTTLFGRMPTWTGACAPVGPWRPVTLRPRAAVEVDVVDLSPVLVGTSGRVDVSLRVSGTVDTVELAAGDRRAALASDASGTYVGSLDLGEVDRWWPATHGAQPLVDVALHLTAGNSVEHVVELGRVGFRTVELGPADAPRLVVNGVEVFVRGVCWVPLDPIGLAPDREAVRAAVAQLRDGGFNVIRLNATTVYESKDFFDACDEFGMMVWNDLMFARMDYPVDDPDFAAEVRAELDDFAASVRGRPSLAVVCGGSEVAQQAVMLGRTADPATMIGGVAKGHLEVALPGVPYVEDTPSGGTYPFTVDTGISHYFGVGAYRRPLDDARLSGVRFASECLAFSNVPCDQTMEELGAAGVVVNDPVWTSRVPRDRGTAWDFEDVRNHYVAELFGADPTDLRFVDLERYLDLGRAATATAMAATFTEWRRPNSSCGGGIVLEGRDTRLGAGPGVIDAAGRPKSVYHALRRVLSPIALLLCDEGLSGLDVWAVNDTADAVTGTLTVETFIEDARADQAAIQIDVAPRSHRRLRAGELFESFNDLTHAYRFGPPSIALLVARWERDGQLLARSTYRPTRRIGARRDVGLSAVARPRPDGGFDIDVSTITAAQWVTIDVADATLSDDWFDIEPGGTVRVVSSTDPVRGRVRALNSASSCSITTDPSALD